MTLRHLRAFIAVADELSFTSAARTLHISQPPLSRQIQQLEKEIGVKLFVRGPHGIALTDRGRVFLDEARRLSAIASEFLETAQRLRREGIDVVRIATASGLWKAMNRLRLHHGKRHRGIDITVEDLGPPGEHHNLGDALRRRQIDVALTRIPVEAPSVEHQVLFQEEIVVLIRQDHRLARARSVRLAQLTGERLLMHERKTSPVLYDKILALYAAAGIAPQVVPSQTNPDAPSGLLQVASGQGIYLTVASPFTQPHAANGIAELALDEPNASTPVLIAWRKDESSKAVVNFVHSALDAFRSAGSAQAVR
jgi:LysR family transcriptional regulator, benzoate and cis,cis-muconate-responsive activator of ben and cat genes